MARTLHCTVCVVVVVTLLAPSTSASQCVNKQQPDAAWPALQLDTLVTETLQPGCGAYYRLDPTTLEGTACAADNTSSQHRYVFKQ